MPKILSDRDSIRVGDMLTDFEGLRQSGKAKGESLRWPKSGWLMARITGWVAVIANAKWRYSWEEILLEGDNDILRGGGRSGSTTDFYALNLWELNNITAHTGAQADGIPQNSSNYPTNFQLLPIGGGSGGVVANQAVVEMKIISDAAGLARPIFTAFNGHFGPCGT